MDDSRVDLLDWRNIEYHVLAGYGQRLIEIQWTQSGPDWLCESPQGRRRLSDDS